MPLDIANTVLISPPYFDNFDESKNFHRVLFRPAVAVQARELTQLQTILQNQIERFGNHIFKDGSVVKGCSVEYINDLEFVGVEDQFSDVPSLAVTNPALLGSIVIGQTSKVQAQVVAARPGFIRQQKPNRFFVRYTNPGANNERTFLPGEELAFYNEQGSYVENIVLTVDDAQPFADAIANTAGAGIVVDSLQIGNTANILGRALAKSANVTTNTVTINSVTRRFASNTALAIRGDNSMSVLITGVEYDLSSEVGRINVLTAPQTDGINVANSDILGFAYGAHVSDGIVYQKGHFIRTESQSVVVNPDTSNPAGFLLGFITNESVVTETADPSLYDNALGYSNFNAPGAHRLKLTADVVSRAANSISNTEIFFPIVEFSNTGATYERTDPQYAALGDEIAKRTYEESGHYIVSPFAISSGSDPVNSNGLIYDISPGLAYVKGFRTELLANLPVKGRKGTNTASYSEQIVTMAIGNYVDVDEVRGYFPTDTGATMVLYDTVQDAVSTNKLPTSGFSGNVIGTANIFDVNLLEGIPGAPDGSYRMHLFNVKMNSNTVSFSRDVKSIAYSPNATHRAFADLKTTGLQESSYGTYLFNLGAKAVKSLRDEKANTVSDNNFYYNSANTALNVALDTAGKINFRVPGGGGILGFTTETETDERKVDIVLTSSATTAADIATGATLNANGLVTATGLGTMVFPGEAILHGANTHRVLLLIDDNNIMVSDTPNAVPAVSGQSLKRYHYAGSRLALTGAGRTIQVNANNEATANLGVTYSSNTAAQVRMYSLQNSGVELKKQVRRSTIVLVDPNQPAPWNLGVPDVFRLAGVYTAAINNANTEITVDRDADIAKNYVDQFVLDTGQRESFYDHASINYLPNTDQSKFAVSNTYLLVEFDHFVANTPGAGFFSVDSYPVDDTPTANNEATIATAEIPVFYSSSQSKVFDLRDAIDFRPYKAATANTSVGARSDIKSCTLSPATTTNFNPLTTTFKPLPGQNFECDFTHYLGRRDAIVATPAGEFRVIEGSSSLNPRSPQPPSESLTIATLEVPPFPSLSDAERRTYNRSDYSVKISVQNQKRFTMKDIGAIESRVSRLEYYTSLNALEKSAADLKITGTGGLDRFKNGIFVDPMNSHVFGRVSMPQYKIAIDEKNGFARPFFRSEFFELDFKQGVDSPGTRQVGSTVVLDFDEVDFLSQEFATSSRKLSGSPPSYQGTLFLSPNRWTEVETGAAPVSINVVSKTTQVLNDMFVPPMSATYGWWRSEKSTKEYDPLLGGGAGGIGLVEESQPIERLRDKTNITSESTYSVDSKTQRSVAIQSFIRPREIAFRAYGLKPYTKHVLFIDDVEQSLRAAPGILINKDALDETAVRRDDIWGSAIETNSRGEAFGMITLPSGMYKTGRHTVKLVSNSIDTLTREQTSAAGALFEADVIYVMPPPPIIVNPPKPYTPQPDQPAPPGPDVIIPPVTVKPRPPKAYFTLCGCFIAVAPQNHVVTVTDASTPGSSAIVSWDFSWGDDTANWTTNNSPPGHTYYTTECGERYTITLRVTDANGLSSTYSESFILTKLAFGPPAATPKAPTPAPGLPPVVPALDSSTIVIESSSGGKINGSGIATGVGSVSASHTAVSSKTFAGAQYTWTVTTDSTTGSESVTNSSPLGASVNQSLNSGASGSTADMSMSVSYAYSNGYVIGSASKSFRLVAENEVKPKSGGCVTVDTIIKGFGRAGDVKVGDVIETMNPKTLHIENDVVTYSEAKMQPCVKIKTQTGVVLECSRTAPIGDYHGNQIMAPDVFGHLIPIVTEEGGVSYEHVTSVEPIEDQLVQHITVGNKFFMASATNGAYLLHHNKLREVVGGGGGGSPEIYYYNYASK